MVIKLPYPIKRTLFCTEKSNLLDKALILTKVIFAGFTIKWTIGSVTKQDEKSYIKRPF